MGRYTGPTHKLCRREGVPICGRDDCPVKTRMTAPGQHGSFRRRLSEYGLQLREKQKAKRTYGVRERQFRRYFKEALRSKERTGEILLQLLERRLDNVIYRAGFAQTRPHARQMISHGLVKLDGHRVTVPSLLVAVGDKITLAKKDAILYDEVVRPSWIKVNEKELIAQVAALPVREEIGAEINESMVVEFYSR
ncbi:30S ribosomal protein S4 [candidate division WWE3 bacterium RIFCSPLOWO2_02_FULL_53_10]|uniref:Small ribosomal subunit protein uS4 n=2 Tax=Katanobacteria TaxID=422282 RepID=A0A1F4WCC0_UNCKA|nr:MAG: 30S ribosomal protein S4 [candidate division WWE3 bacterium RIFCSPLOWO2_01_FULL_53_14]OGC66978.1 MAG: 30S ribosomal protein S4 [candidate division WWE3 bacterium RIFCSPLOWO2_02_FULL_53_10]